MKRIETLEELTFQACTTYLKKNKLRIEDLAGLPGVLVSSFCHRIPLNTKNFFLFFERAIEFSDEVSYHKCMQFARRSFPVLVKVKGEAGLREILGDDVYDEILKEQKDVELFKKKCYREGKILERENVHQTEDSNTFQHLKRGVRWSEDIDPRRREEYLSDEEFQRILGYTREVFYMLPNWKQFMIKESVGLF